MKENGNKAFEKGRERSILTKVIAMKVIG